LSLNITGKKSNLHQIETVVAFVNLYDEIQIKIINSKKNNIHFVGEFSKDISKKNTIYRLLEILEKLKILNNVKFEIKVNKKIPNKAGLGGGSMNAASILKFLIEKRFIFLNKKQDTQKSVQNFLETDQSHSEGINQINEIVHEIENVKDITTFESLIERHEKIIANILQMPTIQNEKFPDYNNGVIKSLGSWGGDFVLATGDEKSVDYFEEKGFNIIRKISDLLYV